ncbi:helix-turn-helix domain-containing protein [Azospirillum canadense]|uniref:helix-turn-helix domain-containing protein n=1 Tax=Azospirillum canadense TaxID=403962 RepID=UPI0022274BB6|nr:helix-turn-helix transcriptional regulator [Azospirillum canadense]MCW2241499.1 transcriptional regulator with XRE-family HTH domain [Azospirillum canadense]
MTPDQCIAARKLLGLSRFEAQRRTGLAYSTLQDVELGATAPPPPTRNRLCAAFEAAGVALDAGAGSGARLCEWREHDGDRP